MKKVLFILLIILYTNKSFAMDKFGFGLGINQTYHGESSIILETHFLPLQIKKERYDGLYYYSSNEIRSGFIFFIDKYNIKLLKKIGFGLAIAFDDFEKQILPNLYWRPIILIYIGKIGNQINTGFSFGF